jgi:hypothetical protein
MTLPQHPRAHVWSLMVQAGIDGEVAHEALGDLIKHVQKVDADKLRTADAALGDVAELEKAAQFLEDPQLQAEYLASPLGPGECGCYPHSPSEPCTCNGCTSCVGREVGCTCDINWYCEHGKD